VSSAPEDHLALRRILRGPGWSISDAADCLDAREQLTWNRIAVVICEGNLPGRGWTDLLHHADEYSEPLTLIVTSADANEHFGMDVRRLGGYDVLAKPFDEREVRRMVDCASHRTIKSGLAYAGM
jgi:DNA-binding NtrC family response regulator